MCRSSRLSGKLWGTGENSGGLTNSGGHPRFHRPSERLRPGRQYLPSRNHEERPLPQALPAQTLGRLVRGIRVGSSLNPLVYK
jgi:hypothetical protein